jgi:hypothetical protein
MAGTAKSVSVARGKFVLRIMARQIECCIGAPTVKIAMLAQAQVAM